MKGWLGMMRGAGFFALELLFAAVTTIGFGLPISAHAQSITEYSITKHVAAPGAITAGPDGALWYVQDNAPATVGRITTNGVITNFPLPYTGEALSEIISGPDGALWFIDQGVGNPNGPEIGRMTIAGAVTEFPLITSTVHAGEITTGPDGALWFTEPANVVPANQIPTNPGKIARITTSGAITEFTLAINSNPASVITGPDRAVWFTESGCTTCAFSAAIPKIGRMTTAGTLTEFSLPSGRTAYSIIAGPDGALWFGEYSGSGTSLQFWIGRMALNGTITEFPANYGPEVITFGADGALWFTTAPANGVTLLHVGRMTTSGAETDFVVPSNGYVTGLPTEGLGIAAGPDGNIWFTIFNQDTIGRIALSTPIAGPLAAAVLPSSRSVQINKTATAFATIINDGSTAANNCAITPVGPAPAGFTYQTTSAATNTTTGTVNTPVTIPPNAAQSFVIGFTPTATLSPTNLWLSFACANTAEATITPGVNTLLLSASTTVTPDVVALGATATEDGILHISGTNGAAAFAVATVNVGASGAITASANTGSATLPLALSICQTNPANGQCLTTAGPTTAATINANATPTFSIFASATGAIPFAPGASRIFVQFTDSTGAVRGSTSVAVETQ